MTRILRVSLFVLVTCALSSPVFAVLCRTCNDQGVCVRLPDSGDHCVQQIDFCQITGSCATVADEIVLADQFSVVSVEVVTPKGMTKTSDAPRVAVHKPLVKLAATPSAR